MAEVTLKKKITLRRKVNAQDEVKVAFSFSNRLKVKLLWSSETDLDLCLFFKRKDGEVGGVFSDGYRGYKKDLGTLEDFPYMQHLGDDPEPTGGNEAVEQINVADLSQIETAYVCIVNYNAALEGEDVTYAEEGGRVELVSDSGDYLEVLADSKETGHIYLVCSIVNKGGQYDLVNESQVMDLGTAFDKIPGFALITNS